MVEPEPLQHVAPTYVRFRGRKLIYFSGCDYLRLSEHPKVRSALTVAARKGALNVAASRLTTGNDRVYRELERRLARFFNAADALLVPDGYLTNLVVAQTLAGEFSHALIDERAHPSLLDAAAFLDCPVLRFDHRSPEGLQDAARRCGPAARLIVLTDGLFSHDGSVAPLSAYIRVLPRDSLILVDDAHGAGVLGNTGKGSLEHNGIGRARVIQTVTLSKAFGVYGGAILGTPTLRRRIVERSRIFIGTTPLPPPLAHASCEAVGVLRVDRVRRRRLRENLGYLNEQLRSLGYPVPNNPGPVLAIHPKNRRAARILQAALLRSGIYPPLIHYPGGGPEGYFRFSISSEHQRVHLDLLIDTLAKARFKVL